MSYRPAVRTLGVTAFALLLGAAVALPAAAAPQESTLPSDMLTAIQRDLGLTTPEADKRLAADATAAATEQTLRAQLGDSFGGSWIDEAGVLVVGTTDAAATAGILATGAQPVVTARSEKDLNAVQSKLDLAGTTAPATVNSWYVDAATNSVVVKAADTGAGDTFVAGAGAVGDSVRVEVGAAIKPFADIIGGEAIHAEAGGRCSVGFSAKKGDATVVVTAGHCTELGGNWQGVDKSALGPVATSAFPTDDYGTISVTSTAWTPTSKVKGSTPVAGSTAGAVGSAVCRSGSTTGFHCGKVEALNATVNYGGGDIVNGLTQTSACAEPGDSGGSVVAGNQAQGMTSGGSGDCKAGGQTFFQPINEALTKLGLTLVVS